MTIDTARCGRCRSLVLWEDVEFCWFCAGYLCYDCWERYGHCGHRRADELNERAKQVAKK